MKLLEYVKKRNGVPMGHPRSLRNNLRRSLGARNFPAFCNFWNPIFGYYLETKIFKPLKEVLPVSMAVVLTIVFCGMVHDWLSVVINKGKVEEQTDNISLLNRDNNYLKLATSYSSNPTSKY